MENSSWLSASVFVCAKDAIPKEEKIFISRPAIRITVSMLLLQSVFRNRCPPAVFCTAPAITTPHPPAPHSIVTAVSIAEHSVFGYREYAAAFQAVYPEEEIKAGVQSCVRYEEKEPVVYTAYGSISGDSIYTGADSLTEFVIDVEAEGFYHMAFSYCPMTESGADIERRILIDGRLPYRELNRVRFGRVWRTGAEEAEWIVSDLSDSMGYVEEPLAVYLTEGEHRIALVALAEPMLLHQIISIDRSPSILYRRQNQTSALP